MRTSTTSLAVAALVLAPATTQAQDTNPACPPGSWFCEDVPPATTAPPPELPPPTPVPPPATAPKTTGTPAAPASPPPVVIYQQTPPPPPPVVVVRQPPRYVLTPPPPPPPPKRAYHRMWGFNLHLLGVMMDSHQADTAGMGGLGFTFRVRPERHFALDFGLDLVGGRDYLGHRRSEVPFSVSALVYANPKNVVQFYMLGGLGWSSASVDIYDDRSRIENYSYFGGQLGAGLEVRLTPPVSLNFDLVGFIRGRTDAAARDVPEFTDPETGQTTNTSGGGMLRGGVTFYW
jgi:opacity protein-like surface antigen